MDEDLRDGEGLRPFQAIQTYRYIEAIFHLGKVVRDKL